MKARERRIPPIQERKKIVASQGGLCACCGCCITANTCDIDHIEALVNGGGNSRRNLSALCKKCHKVKSALEYHTPKKNIRTNALKKNKSGWKLAKSIMSEQGKMLKWFTPDYAYCIKKRQKIYYSLRRWVKKNKAECFRGINNPVIKRFTLSEQIAYAKEQKGK